MSMRSWLVSSRGPSRAHPTLHTAAHGSIGTETPPSDAYSTIRMAMVSPAQMLLQLQHHHRQQHPSHDHCTRSLSLSAASIRIMYTRGYV